MGANAAPIMPARLKVKDAPEYRTVVGNNSERKVPIGPYVNPINAIPKHKKKVTKVVFPEFRKNEKNNPKIAIATEAYSNIFRRPILSAITAETGIKPAKNKTENNCIKSASLLEKCNSFVFQFNINTVIK